MNIGGYYNVIETQHSIIIYRILVDPAEFFFFM